MKYVDRWKKKRTNMPTEMEKYGYAVSLNGKADRLGLQIKWTPNKWYARRSSKHSASSGDTLEELVAFLDGFEAGTKHCMCMLNLSGKGTDCDEDEAKDTVCRVGCDDPDCECHLDDVDYDPEDDYDYDKDDPDADEGDDGDDVSF